MLKKFEYKIFKVPYGGFSTEPKIDLQATLNQFGLEGWELVASTHTEIGLFGTLVFKREIIG